jgi:hypothetical protein
VNFVQAVQNVQAPFGQFKTGDTRFNGPVAKLFQTFKTFEPRETSRDRGDACDGTDGVVGRSKALARTK